VFFDTVQLTLLQPVVTKQHHRGKKVQMILSSPVWAISKKQRDVASRGLTRFSFRTRAGHLCFKRTL
jgi:hypothetical protein